MKNGTYDHPNLYVTLSIMNLCSEFSGKKCIKKPDMILLILGS